MAGQTSLTDKKNTFTPVYAAYVANPPPPIFGLKPQNGMPNLSDDRVRPSRAGKRIPIHVIVFRKPQERLTGQMAKFYLEIMEKASERATVMGAYVSYWMLLARTRTNPRTYIQDNFETTTYLPYVHVIDIWNEAKAIIDERWEWNAPSYGDLAAGEYLDEADVAIFFGLYGYALTRQPDTAGFDKWIEKRGNRLRSAAGGLLQATDYKIGHGPFKVISGALAQSVKLRRALLNMLANHVPAPVSHTTPTIIQYTSCSYLVMISDYLVCRGRPHPAMFLTPCLNELEAYGQCVQELEECGEDPRYGKILASQDKFTINANNMRHLINAAVTIGKRVQPSLTEYAGTVRNDVHMSEFVGKVAALDGLYREKGLDSVTRTAVGTYFRQVREMLGLHEECVKPAQPKEEEEEEVVPTRSRL